MRESDAGFRAQPKCPGLLADCQRYSRGNVNRGHSCGAGRYVAGGHNTCATSDVITVAVTFDEAVTVETSGGRPYLGLRIGGDTRNAAYTGIDPANTVLTFSYTVVAEDSDQNGVSISHRAIRSNGSRFTAPDSSLTPALTNAGLDHQRGHLVNRIPRVATFGVRVTSSPHVRQTCRAGETISFGVTFD